MGFTYVSASLLLLSKIYGQDAKDLDINERFWCKSENIDYVAEVRKIKNIDQVVDQALVKMADKKSNCVFDTRTLPWLYTGSNLVKIYFSASLDDRVGISILSKKTQEYTFEVLREKIIKKDEQDIALFKSLYGIEIDSPKGFDLVINNGPLAPESTHQIICDYLQGRKIYKSFAPADKSFV